MQGQNFINGMWRDGVAQIANINPSDTSDVIGHFTQASHDDLTESLAAARRAQAEWWAMGIEARHNVLMAIGTEMMARADELGEMISREEGKPRAAKA